MPPFLLVLLIPLIGLVALVVALTGDTSLIGPVFQIALWMVGGYIVLSLVFRKILGSPAPQSTSLHTTDEWAGLDPTKTHITRLHNGFRLDYEDRSFVVVNHRGVQMAREYDRTNGVYLSAPIYGNGRGRLGDLIKYKINTGT